MITQNNEQASSKHDQEKSVNSKEKPKKAAGPDQQRDTIITTKINQLSPYNDGLANSLLNHKAQLSIHFEKSATPQKMSTTFY